MPVYTVGTADGLPLRALKSTVVARVDTGETRMVLDLRAAGRLSLRTVGSLLYAHALCRAVGGALALRLSAAQRTALAPFPFLLDAAEA